jgi:peptidoglycan/xylan/chitin deacetylase (PgdA/CDA1 family)
MPGLKRRLHWLAHAVGLLDLALKARRSPPTILMYHGVSAESEFRGLRNAAQLHLPREDFIAQMRLLKKHRKVIAISEMVDGLRHGDDLSNTVALTFDDGYDNNLRVAAPILADHAMPASVFLATDHIGTHRWIWTDRIERAFDQTSVVEVRLDDDLVLPLAAPHARRLALHAAKRRLKQLSVAERDAALYRLCRQLGVADTQPYGDYRFLDWSQARQLADAGFEVGAHTVHHATLSRLPAEEAEREILQSRDAVAAGVGRCCPVFCYPNGKPEDLTPAVIDTCRRHFTGALATTRGPARPEELYQLARVAAWGGSAELAWALLRPH